MNRNRLAESTSLKIGIWVVCAFQKLRKGIGRIFVRREVFANYSQITEIFLSLSLFSSFLFLDSYILFLQKNNITNKLEKFTYCIYLFSIEKKYSIVIWKIIVKRINTCERVIFDHRNNIHKVKFESICDLNINK